MNGRQRLKIQSGIALFAVVVIAVAASSMEAVPVPDNSITGMGNSSVTPQGTVGCVSVPIFPGCFQWSEILSQFVGVSSSFNPRFGRLSTLLALGLLATVTVGSIAVIFWATGDRTSEALSTGEFISSDADSRAQDSKPSTPPIPKPTNDVYRAWWELVRYTDLLDWRSQSPAEVATAAIEAGVEPEIVAEITTLFRTIRYGDRPLTDDTERRASTALDRLQSYSTPSENGVTDS